ncbi:short-chain dehydrogenase [Pseudomonas veronii]
MSATKEILKDIQKFPTPQDFCLNISLYKSIPVTELTLGGATHFLRFDGHLDMYCPACGAVSVFQCSTNYQYQVIQLDYWFRQEFLTIIGVCSRADSHQAAFLFRLNEDAGIEKVGQYPSSADVGAFDVKKYDKVLSKENFTGLKTAIGLSAHGVGAGALVYLRRIFESLIIEAHGIASKESSWNEALYKNGRMQERVKLLRDHLPDFLVEHHKLYGILSHGIHEMPEDQCREYFPVLKMSIELILDQKLMESERQRKIKEAAAFITQFDPQ